MSKFLRRVLTALLLVAVCVPAFYLGGIALKVLIIAFIVLGSKEIASMQDSQFHPLWTIVTCIATLGMAFVPSQLYPAVIAGWVMLAFLIEIFDPRESAEITSYAFLMSVMVGLASRALLHMYASSNTEGFKQVLLVLLCCYLCDTGAYMIGSRFGKNKMVPHISPNKTWEGTIGGYAVGVLSGLIYGLLVLKKIYPVWFIVSCSLLLPIAGMVGDLAFSMVKRHFGLKDFSNLLPGHGGVLDRIDSLVFCLMIYHGLSLVLAGGTL